MSVHAARSQQRRPYTGAGRRPMIDATEITPGGAAWMIEATMRYGKMRETGGEYVCVDSLDATPPTDAAALARAVCARAGGAAVVLLTPSDRADARVRLFLADGSEPESAGRGLVSAATFLAATGRLAAPRFRLDTDRGVCPVEVELQNGLPVSVRIDMGKPVFEAERIPTRLQGNPPVEVPMTWPDTVHNVTCLSLGDPHCVIFAYQVTDELVRNIGPELERHPLFPQRTSVAFVKVNRRDDVTVRLWQRGGGEVPGTATGACAVVVAGALAGRTQRQLTAHLPGGDFELHWSDRDDNHIFLRGRAEELVRGDWPAA